MTKKAEVWAPDQGGKIHSHVRAFHQGCGSVSRRHINQSLLFHAFVHPSFIFLILYARATLLMTGSGVAFTTIAAAAMKDDLPGRQSISDNIIILSSR
jgi:hypothetical protein